ncbi:MAG: methyltransferase domain-containing protein [Alphaproteobacteria bacterium]|nr:methyltransferase domain-containing protein [Alphaproteobacteria bacterium]
MDDQPHATAEPSPFVAAHAGRIAAGGTVLDLACGAGRHTRLLLGKGLRVMAVDINLAGLADLAGTPGLAMLEADLENGPWPLGNANFDGVVVTNYLWRLLFPRLREAVAPGGVLIYETFAEGNEAFGKPSNPDFLLKRDELLDWFGDWQVAAYEQLVVETPKPAVIQHICAVRPPA